MNEKVLIVGAGTGLSASIARLCSSEGMEVALAARNIDKLVSLKKEINAKTFKCDASDINEVSSLFRELDQSFGIPNLVIYNPSSRIRGAIGDLDPKETQEAINITCFGGFLVAQEASKRMLKNKKGSIFFTGASASIKGFANSSVFAMGKFGLRGLAQSLARELHPQNIHIGHFIIDGGIGKSSTGYKLINPDSIANIYLEVHKQDSSAWTWEVELRTNKETF
jgi:short-subunit dehydrogenase